MKSLAIPISTWNLLVDQDHTYRSKSWWFFFFFFFNFLIFGQTYKICRTFRTKHALCPESRQTDDANKNATVTSWWQCKIWYLISRFCCNMRKYLFRVKNKNSRKRSNQRFCFYTWKIQVIGNPYSQTFYTVYV